MIDSSASEQRIDRYIKKLLPKASKGEIQRWLRTKKVKLNRQKVSPSYRLQVGDQVNIFLPDLVIEDYLKKVVIVSEKSGLDIVYEDEDILIVNKPEGLLVHPDKSEYKRSLSSYVKHYLAHLVTPTFSPASINRLDKNTSGLVLFAKNYQSLKLYNQKMRERQIKKYYQAIVEGKITKEREIKGYLYKDSDKNQSYFRAEAMPSAKAIHSIVRPLEYKNNYSRVEIELLTGRSHQIRLSLAEIGHPLIGDSKYGGKKIKDITYQVLHAEKLIIDDKVFTKSSQRFDEIWQNITN